MSLLPPCCNLENTETTPDLHAINIELTLLIKIRNCDSLHLTVIIFRNVLSRLSYSVNFLMTATFTSEDDNLEKEKEKIKPTAMSL